MAVAGSVQVQEPQVQILHFRGRGTGRGGLRDTVERRLPVHGHCEGEREEQEGELGTGRPRENQSSERAPFPTVILWEPQPTGGELPKPPKAKAFLA